MKRVCYGLEFPTHVIDACLTVDVPYLRNISLFFCSRNLFNTDISTDIRIIEEDTSEEVNSTILFLFGLLY